MASTRLNMKSIASKSFQPLLVI